MDSLKEECLFLREINKSWNQIADTNLMNIKVGSLRIYPSNWFVIGPSNVHFYRVGRRLDLSRMNLWYPSSRPTDGGYINNSFEDIFEELPEDIQEGILFNLDIINRV